jgi:hypothetical protein
MNLTFLCQLEFGTSTRSRSPPEFSGGSRPTTGRDPEKKSGRDPCLVATQKKNPVATEVCGRGPVGKIFSLYYSHRKYHINIFNENFL